MLDNATTMNFQEAAQLLNCDVLAIKAVAEVEREQRVLSDDELRSCSRE